MQAAIMEFLEDYKDDALGVTVNSDINIMLCMAMIQIGEFAGVEEIYLRAISDSPAREAKDMKSDQGPLRQAISGIFALHVEVEMLTMALLDKMDAWRLQVSATLSALARCCSGFSGIHVSAMFIGVIGS
ncbi:hypothetical protein HK101_011919 [Irineochytrium annulatum]|nr:hypothetical protein HK101_011919 [Irineochytrium annulatum]